MAGRAGLAHVIPAGFEGYARLLHPFDDGRPWRDAAPAYLGDGTTPYAYPFPVDISPREGDMGTSLVDALVPVLRPATATPDRCHFGLWTGWAGLRSGRATVLWAGHPRKGLRARVEARRELRRLGRARRRREGAVHAFVGACPVEPWWGARDMALFDGPVEKVASIGTAHPLIDGVDRRGPQWWWPEDRRWFVATDIDYPWTYVGGPASLVDAVAVDPGIEAVRVNPTALW